MNRRGFIKSLVAACLSRFVKQKDDDDEYIWYFPMVARNVVSGCVPSEGTPFRLDISTLDSGHLLSC